MRSNKEIRNIGFISTRIAGTDGVSFEIEKWATVLERKGLSCFYFAGEVDRPHERCHIVDQAFFRHPVVAAINEAVFSSEVRSPEVSALIGRTASALKNEIAVFAKKFGIDCVIAENAVTIPMNIPLGIAVTEFIAETGIPAIAHHHDFYWERSRFMINSVNDLLQRAFPPVLPSIEHVVINSLARAQLSFRRGLSSVIIPNVFDFKNRPGDPDNEMVRSIRSAAGIAQDEYFILQPTRVVPRKWIERSIDLVAGMGGRARKLVISHASGDEGDQYSAMLREYAGRMGVELVCIDHLVHSGREDKGNGFYIGDVYQAADLITYPSGYEGFGNAFLEAVYFRKPILVNRYPVFIADIQQKGFDLCLIDGFISTDTIRMVERVLENADLRERMTEKNYETAARHFNFEILESRLMNIVRGFA